MGKVTKVVIDTNVSPVSCRQAERPAGRTSALERQIDEMVYALYGLTPEEIAVVEGKE